MRALIVDDQASSRSILRCVLEKAGGMELHIRDFGDPAAAIAFAQGSQLDIVIVDYRMPGMDGLEFTRRLRRQRQHSGVPILIVSAMHDSALRAEAIEAGALDLIQKPITPRLFTLRCKSILSMRRDAGLMRDANLALKKQLAWALKSLDARERELVLRGL